MWCEVEEGLDELKIMFKGKFEMKALLKASKAQKLKFETKLNIAHLRKY